MREVPEVPPADQILAVVRSHWAPGATRLEHLPAGSGADHWAAEVDAPTRLFVTFDRFWRHHDEASLEATYAAAAELQTQGLEFVLAPLRSRRGRYTVPLAAGALSVTPWRTPRPLRAAAAGDPAVSWAVSREVSSVGRLRRLHAAAAPAGLPRWHPRVPEDLPERLAVRTSRLWTTGPYGEPARRAVRVRLDRIQRWTADYHVLASRTDPATWVPTHGEPHADNILSTAEGELLVDWESLQLAPRERDLSELVGSGGADWVPHYRGPGSDWEPDLGLVDMFDLEWRLDEITHYAAWFAAPHHGTDDDHRAFGGLMHELSRDPRVERHRSG